MRGQVRNSQNPITMAAAWPLTVGAAAAVGGGWWCWCCTDAVRGGINILSLSCSPPVPRSSSGSGAAWKTHDDGLWRRKPRRQGALGHHEQLLRVLAGKRANGAFGAWLRDAGMSGPSHTLLLRYMMHALLCCQAAERCRNFNGSLVYSGPRIERNATDDADSRGSASVCDSGLSSCAWAEERP